MMHLDMQTIPGRMFHQQGDVRQNEVLVENKAKAGDTMHACMFSSHVRQWVYSANSMP